MEEPSDMLQIKINKAKEELSKETIRAIDSVGWRAYVLSLREKKGYSFEQLEDLELETELLLCGLLAPENYPKELEERMKIPKPQVDLLVNEMNEFIFKKIKDELIKNTERSEMFVKTVPTIKDVEGPTESIEKNEILANNVSNQLAVNTPEKISVPVKEEEETNKEDVDKKTIESILTQKLSGSFQIPTVKTQYSLDNLSKTGPTSTQINDKVKNLMDPYKEIPE